MSEEFLKTPEEIQLAEEIKGKIKAWLKKLRTTGGVDLSVSPPIEAPQVTWESDNPEGWAVANRQVHLVIFYAARHVETPETYFIKLVTPYPTEKKSFIQILEFKEGRNSYNQGYDYYKPDASFWYEGVKIPFPLTREVLEDFNELLGEPKP